MEKFKVTGIINGNTLEISPNWKLEDNTTGNVIYAVGYDAPKSGKGAIAVEQRLSIMLQNKDVELGEPRGVQDGRLICDVYYNGINLADYFSEFKEQEDVSVDDTEDETDSQDNNSDETQD